ncbi:MAG: hypothetical protein Q9178_002521 [Gyalolechia marmorata]
MEAFQRPRYANRSSDVGLYASPVFSIYAGPARKHLVAHATVLNKSPTLQKVIDGDWKDSKDRAIDFEEWDETTISQLLDYLYTGQYKLIIITSQPNSNKGIEAELTNDIPSGDFNGAQDEAALKTSEHIGTTPSVHETSRVEPLISGNPLTPPYSAPTTPSIEAARQHAIETGSVLYTTEGISEHSTRQDCTLLQHSRLYVLAHYLELTDLKNLAIASIESITESIKELNPQLLSNIVQLIQYVYISTDTLVNSKEPLRELVATFAAKWFHVFEGNAVKALMEEGGDFVVDVMHKVQQHVHDMKVEHEGVEKDLQKQIKKYQTKLRKRGGRVDGDNDNGHSGWDGW